MNHVYTAESEMGSSAQQLCIVRMNVAKAVFGRCRQMQCICGTQEDRCRQSGINELRAFDNALRQGQPSERFATRFVKELLERNLEHTRTDSVLPELSVEG